MDKTYMDESHCLVGPEIRSDEDNPISCYCRDAIANARYVYFTYLLPAKDRNLNGTLLELQYHAHEMCGYGVWEAITTETWKWNGPEVARTYPPDSETAKIKPVKGFRTVEYKVRLTYRDSQARVTKVENFAAWEMVPARDGDSYIVIKHVAEGDRYVIRHGDVEIQARCQYSTYTVKGDDKMHGGLCLESPPVGVRLKMARGTGDWLFCNWNVRDTEWHMGLIVEKEEVKGRKEN